MTRDAGKEAGADTSLEGALARLEEISRCLEEGELELAESLALYEEGVHLLRTCDALLSQAEQRVEQIRPQGSGFRLDALEERP